MRIFDAACEENWAIREDMLVEILSIADRASSASPAEIEAYKNRYDQRITALEITGGDRLQGAESVTVRDGVAVIPIVGPIFRRANLFTEMSGATSHDMLAKDLGAAMSNSGVKAIMLAIDSPGGTVNGTAELANMIKDAAGDKPLAAYIGGNGLSAAYWIATAAPRIVVDETASLGSIGVMATMSDTSDRDRASGVKQLKFISSQSPMKNADPNTEAGAISLQQHIDKIAEIFVGTVARNRGVSVDTVLQDFGRGDVLVGADAVRVGMADDVGSHEALLAELASDMRKGAPFQVRGSTQTSEDDMTKKLTATELATEQPDAVAEIKAAAKAEGIAEANAAATPITLTVVKENHANIAATLAAEGAAAERTRVADLNAASLPGFENVLQECIDDGKSTATDLSVKIVAAQRQQGSTAKTAAEREEQELASLPASETAVDTVDDPTDPDAADKKAWDADASLRKDFGDNFAAYQRGKKDEREGNLKGAKIN